MLTYVASSHPAHTQCMTMLNLDRTTTLPGPNTACPTTPTSTSHLPCETACPRGCGTYTSTLTYSSSCLPTTTPPAPTITAHSRPCFSHTTTISGKCPEDGTVCPPPDCIYLSTTTVPAGPVLACPTTPTVTVTRTRTCLGRCDGACGTQWSTETATGW